MAQVLRRLTPVEAEPLLVDADALDDAAVWRIDDDRALVATVDVITPLVDDARTWGRIAAVNAVSDVYAMGGRPLFGLNIVAWNRGELSLELLSEVLAGAADAAAGDGWLSVGGHTIDAVEPTFGLAVIGEVKVDRVLRNGGLRPGDWLVLSKPLGVGVLTTAIKRGDADPRWVDAAVASMLRSNANAARVALEAGATSATDVTGFGLLGHLGRMTIASGVDAILSAAEVPSLPGARELAKAGLLPGGSVRNRRWVEQEVLDPRSAVDPATLAFLCDAQTSGGLLFGVAGHDAAEVAAERLRADGHDAAVIGHATQGTGRITVAA